jgi:hypothetical protein
MTQIVFVSLNGQDLGMRFTSPFRFDLSSALRVGQNELVIRHVERYSFTSRLGLVRLVPYYSLAI